MLLNGQAEQAEKVFRTDFLQYPRNPRSLFGLMKALEAQKKLEAAEAIRKQFEAAWKDADTTLLFEDL